MTSIQFIFTSGVALLAALMSSCVDAAVDQPLPWDGRFNNLTVASLTDKYLTHILTNRQSGTVTPDKWTTVIPNGRSPAYNSDSGVVALAVDSKAIFGGQSNFRRSELVQNVAGNTAGTTFFRVSLMKKKAYVNRHSWQLVFPESHLFEIRLDASVDPVMLVWYTGGSTETRWSTEFKIKTWYNFGIAVSSGKLDLYFSEGNDDLKLTKSEKNNGAVPANYEFHFGQLTLSNDGSAVKMVEGEQDVLSFNGVSVEDKIPSGSSSSSLPTSSSTKSLSSASTPEDSPTTPTDIDTDQTNTHMATVSAKTPSDESTDVSGSTKTGTTDKSYEAPIDSTNNQNDETSTTYSTDTDHSKDTKPTGNSNCKVRRR